MSRGSWRLCLADDDDDDDDADDDDDGGDETENIDED